MSQVMTDVLNNRPDFQVFENGSNLKSGQLMVYNENQIIQLLDIVLKDENKLLKYNRYRKVYKIAF